MAKPRVVIADTDISYIIPLQQKFVEEYFEKIDLEIISNPSYFIQFFSSPQKIDILIISEELYTPTIKKHNIGNLFLMTEQYNTSSTNEINLFPIYKYTSIREIFNEIVGRVSGHLKTSNIDKKGTQVILVYSACGGVGKTTISFGICACLNKNYKKALYINAARLQVFQMMLSDPSPISSSDVYTKLATSNDDAFSVIKQTIRNEGFSYLPPFKASLMSLGIKNSVFEEILLSAKKAGEFDYIIIDTDVVFDEDKSRLIDIADKVIVVTKQDKISAYATNILMSNINGSNTDKYIFVCNDFDASSTNVLISPDIVNKFSVSEYIGHISNYEQMNANDLANETDIQKVTFLII